MALAASPSKMDEVHILHGAERKAASGITSIIQNGCNQVRPECDAAMWWNQRDTYHGGNDIAKSIRG